MRQKMARSFSLNEPQAEFLSVKKKFNGFVGGYRSGKTVVGCVRQWMLAAMYPGIKLGYFAPTYPMISDIFYSTIAEVGEMLSGEFDAELTVDINVSRKEVKLLFDGVEYAMVKCRAMENPHRIVGFDINHAQIDEIDTMKRQKADAAWKKIIARMSSVRDDYPINTVDFTTTPEGFNFVYDLFVVQTAKDKDMAAHYSLTKASTRKNAKNLPKDYIKSLYDTYPSQLVNAYVDGEFVNLTSGTVYYAYNRNRCRSHEVIKENEPLFIGQDFNVGKMASTVYVQHPSIAL
jgi:phage terminase large subunit-like protein